MSQRAKSSEQAVAYYCTACGVESFSAKACPKCHRKGTLQPIDGGGGGGGGPRRRLKAGGGAATARTTQNRLIALTVVGVTAVLAAAVTIFLATRGGDKKQGKKVLKKDKGLSALGPRVFGAPPKGQRPGVKPRAVGTPPMNPGAPPTPPPAAPAPKLCGDSYVLKMTTDYGLANTGQSTPPTPGQPQRPELLEMTQGFLLVPQPKKGHALVLTQVKREIQLAGRRIPMLAFDKTGGIALDRRTRRPVKLRPDQQVFRGVRVSDIIGRAQAELTVEANAFKIARVAGRHPFVQGVVTTAVVLSNFLTPNPPTPTAALFVDSTGAPPGIIGPPPSRAPGAAPPAPVPLVRRYRRKPGGARTYSIDSPPALMTKHKATYAVRGEVTLEPNKQLPKLSKLSFLKVPVGKEQRLATVTLHLEHKGKACNKD